MLHKPLKKSEKPPRVNREELNNSRQLFYAVESRTIGADNHVRRASRKIQRLLSDSPEVAKFWRSLSPEVCGSFEFVVTLLDLNAAPAPQLPDEPVTVSPHDLATFVRLTEESRSYEEDKLNLLARWKLLELKLGRAVPSSEFLKMASTPEAKP